MPILNLYWNQRMDQSKKNVRKHFNRLRCVVLNLMSNDKLSSNYFKFIIQIIRSNLNGLIKMMHWWFQFQRGFRCVMNEWMDNDQKNYNNLIKSWHANNLNLNDNQKQTMHANECSNGAATWLQNLSTITFRLINFWTSPKLSTQTGEQWIISKKYWWWHDFKNKI